MVVCSATKVCSKSVKEGLKNTQKKQQEMQPMLLLIIWLGYLVLMINNTENKSLENFNELIC